MTKKIMMIATLICCVTICLGQKNGLDKIDFNKSAAANINNIKSVESGMKFVGQSAYKTATKNISAGGYYISIFETTNGIYNAFLKDLKDNGLDDIYNTCKVDGEGWMRISEAFESTAKTYHTDAKWNEYPVVNISKDAA